MAAEALSLVDCINSACPWSGRPVVPEGLTRYRGRVVGFCNSGCRDKFEAAIRAFDAELETSEGE